MRTKCSSPAKRFSRNVRERGIPSQMLAGDRPLCSALAFKNARISRVAEIRFSHSGSIRVELNLARVLISPMAELKPKCRLRQEVFRHLRPFNQSGTILQDFFKTQLLDFFGFFQPVEIEMGKWKPWSIRKAGTSVKVGLGTSRSSIVGHVADQCTTEGGFTGSKIPGKTQQVSRFQGLPQGLRQVEAYRFRLSTTKTERVAVRSRSWWDAMGTRTLFGRSLISQIPACAGKTQVTVVPLPTTLSMSTVAAVKLDEAFDDGKAEACALAASTRVMTDKTIEDLGAEFPQGCRDHGPEQQRSPCRRPCRS
jgi:hypothetical protein